MGIEVREFGKIDSELVEAYTLTNDNGMSVEVITYGGTIVSLNVPDRHGNTGDVVLGYDTLEQYLAGDAYFGALIGRHANRIEDAQFEIDGKCFKLAQNDGDNHLHGGLKGFDKVIWQADILSHDEPAIQLSYLSEDGEENYPGTLRVKVVYSLSLDNGLRIDYSAEADQNTVVNLTNHAYFNLAGHGTTDILGHHLQINGDFFTPVDDECIPTGEIRQVTGTPMDFSSLRQIGETIDQDDLQLRNGGGYDHNWVLRNSGQQPGLAAKLYEPTSGRLMEVYTTKPGVQFYSGNQMKQSCGKQGVTYDYRGGLCLETQYFPNGLKYPHFPSPLLRAGEKYEHTTIYKFLVQD